MLKEMLQMYETVLGALNQVLGGIEEGNLGQVTVDLAGRDGQKYELVIASKKISEPKRTGSKKKASKVTKKKAAKKSKK